MPLDPELLATYDAIREGGEDAESIARRVEVNADDPATAAELRAHFGVKQGDAPKARSASKGKQTAAKS